MGSAARYDAFHIPLPTCPLQLTDAQIDLLHDFYGQEFRGGSGGAQCNCVRVGAAAQGVGGMRRKCCHRMPSPLHWLCSHRALAPHTHLRRSG